MHSLLILIASGLFMLAGIEEIGVQIEEPFSILALENLCKKAERHISGMMLMDDTTYNLVQRQQQQQPQAHMSWQHAMNMSVFAAAVTAPVNNESSSNSDGMVD
jgi:2-keto-4-pentenoate hydratase/2-oxohepta-3-ene-1,7-dioic acid hydratase in catechol pathway